MATTPEGKVKDAVKGVLKKHGVFFFMPVPTGFGVMGISDFIGVIPQTGRFLAVEAKSDVGQPTELQKLFMASVVACGGVAIVVRGTNMTVLEELLDEEKNR